MNLRNIFRTFTTFLAGGAIVVGLTTSVGATSPTFEVLVQIDASCTVGDDISTGFFPNYDPLTDTSVGNPIGLGFSCTGTSPTIAFTDPDNASSASTVFVMHDNEGSSVLNYQISNTASCSGVVGDGPLVSGFANAMAGTPASFNQYNVCVAVIKGQTEAAPGTYTDTVTYTVDPGD